MAHGSWTDLQKWYAVFAAYCPDYDAKKGGCLGRESTLAKLNITALEIWDERLNTWVPVELGAGGHRFKGNTPETARKVKGPGESVLVLRVSHVQRLGDSEGRQRCAPCAAWDRAHSPHLPPHSHVCPAALLCTHSGRSRAAPTRCVWEWMGAGGWIFDTQSSCITTCWGSSMHVRCCNSLVSGSLTPAHGSQRIEISHYSCLV
jgi:hypothetical protein